MVIRLGLIVALPLLLFAPYLLGSMTFIPSDLNQMTLPWQESEVPADTIQNHYLSDALVEHYPWKVLIRDEILRGELPLWNPFNYLGLPLLAGSTAVVTDPLNILLGYLALPLAFHWLVALQFIGTGLGFYWFLRCASLGRWAALFGALAYEFNAQFVVNLPFHWMLGGFLWIPVSLGALEKATRQGGTAWYGIAALALGISALSSSVQIVLAGCLAWTLYLLGRRLAFRQIEGQPASESALRYGGIVFGLAMGIGAAHLIPAGELIWHSWGARQFDLVAWMADFPRRIALVAFLPVFAVPYLAWGPGSLDVLKPLGTASDYFNGFIGIVPVCFGLVGGRYAKGPVASAARWLVLGGLAMALLTPIGLYLYHRMLIIYVLGVSILAAVALDMLLNTDSREEARLRVFSAVSRLATVGITALALTVGTLMIVFRLFATPIQRYGEQLVRSQLIHSTSRYSSFQQFYLDRVVATWQHYARPDPGLQISLMVLGVFWLLLWIWKGRVGWAGPVLAGVLLLTSVDLAFYFWRYIPRVSLDRHPLYPVLPSTQFLMNQPGLFRILVLRDFRDHPPILPLESNIPYGLHNVHGWGSIPLLETKRFYEDLGLRDVDRESNVPLSSWTRRAADALNVRFFLTAPGVAINLEDVTLVYRGEIWIYENHRAYPRAYAVGGYELVSSSKVARERFKEALAADMPSVFLEAAGPQDRPPVGSPTGLSKGKVSVVSYEPRRVSLETEGAEGSIVVLSDAHYPGWYAKVDEQEAPVFRANGIVRAVFVPAGKHHVMYWFDPPSVRIGFFITAGSSLAALVWSLLALGRECRWMRRKPNPSW